MRITPLDIKKQEFQTKFRGFDKIEVESFLGMVAGEMEELVRENLELKEKILRMQDRLESYTKIEAALQNTLITTQESVEQMKASAEEKAELIVREANAQAEKIIDDAYEKLSEMRREHITLRNQRASFLVNFRSLLESQLKLMEMIEKDADDRTRVVTLKRKADMSETDVDQVVENFKRETGNIASRPVIVNEQTGGNGEIDKAEGK